MVVGAATTRVAPADGTARVAGVAQGPVALLTRASRPVSGRLSSPRAAGVSWGSRRWRRGLFLEVGFEETTVYARESQTHRSIDTATTGDESTMMASNEEIADDAALAGQADAFSIGDAIRWLKLGQQRRSSGDVREQAEASAMLESATQGGYMFYNSFGGVAGMYAAVEDCVRDERNRQQALQDEMEGTLEARYGMDPSQFSGGVKVAPPELTQI